MKKLIRFLVIILILVSGLLTYVEIANRNSVKMTYRQKVLKAVYPAFIWWTKLAGKNTRKLAHEEMKPAMDLYDIKSLLNDGTSFNLMALRGKKILLVNTASDCGYTNQYADLEKLYQLYKDKLAVIAFPSNDFKDQEKGNDSAIALFCINNYHISFPIMAKSQVVKGPGQNETYQWLTDRAKNGWNTQAPVWNFSKYLVDEKGSLVNFFGPSVTPLSDEIKNEINK